VTRPLPGMDSDWSVTSLDGHDVTLVTVDLRNPSPVDRRVRVSNRLDGPVLPPKRAGVPESGWDETGFDGVVPAAGRRTLGYACPAPVAQPPVSVVDEGRADEDDADAAALAIRELGDPRPPGDAIPSVGEAENDELGGEPPAPTDAEPAVPPAAESWLTTVEARIDRGERLTDASVESATAALGEVDDASELAEQVSADAAALDAVAERTAALAERASAVDVPVEALRRLP
jgi:hypothetical protein